MRFIVAVLIVLEVCRIFSRYNALIRFNSEHVLNVAWSIPSPPPAAVENDHTFFVSVSPRLDIFRVLMP